MVHQITFHGCDICGEPFPDLKDANDHEAMGMPRFHFKEGDVLVTLPFGNPQHVLRVGKLYVARADHAAMYDIEVRGVTKEGEPVELWRWNRHEWDKHLLGMGYEIIGNSQLKNPNLQTLVTTAEVEALFGCWDDHEPAVRLRRHWYERTLGLPHSHATSLANRHRHPASFCSPYMEELLTNLLGAEGFNWAKVQYERYLTMQERIERTILNIMRH